MVGSAGFLIQALLPVTDLDPMAQTHLIVTDNARDIQDVASSHAAAEQQYF
jgi:hypothetical protein